MRPMMGFLRERRNSEAGFTLVELMIGIVVSAIVIAAAFTILTTSRRALKVNEQVVDMQQSARMAMELLSRDIKMAGFGYPSATIGNCQIAGQSYAIVPNDQTPTGADSGPDSVQLLVPTTRTEGTNRWTLSNATSSNGASQITLQAGAVTDMVNAGLTVGSYISIGGASTVGVTSINAGSNSLGVNIPPPQWFQVEDQVYLLQCIRYQVVPLPDAGNLCLGGAPCLTRGVAGATNGSAEAPIAQGIEDLQLAYACDGCVTTINSGIPDRVIDDQNASNSFDQGDFLSNKTWTTAPLTPDKIKLVQIALVARQSQNDQGLGESDKGAMGSDQLTVSADRTLAADSNHRRRILSRTVELRNVGL